MSSRNAAKKMKPSPRSSAKVAKLPRRPVKLKARPKAKVKFAKVTKFPTRKPVAKTARKPVPAPQVRRSAPPPPAPPPQRQIQPPKQSLARSFYWSELRVGDDLPPLSKQAIDRVQIARYAAASGDFNRLHLDEPFAHALGFPGLFAPGALAMGFVGQLLTSWLRRGHVRKLSARFVKIVWPGDELTCRGRIADLRKEGGSCWADVELWAENQKGELVLRGLATCELYEAPGAGEGGGGLLFALQQPQQKRGATPSRKPVSKKR